MRPPAALLMLALLPAACAAIPPPPDTARMPANAFGLNLDPDVGAINQAAWAFASPANTANRPIEAARAVAAVDYLGGELNTNPRWVRMDTLTRQDMLVARAQLREVVGIAPAAPSQAVVDQLLAAANALQQNNPAQAAAALQGPTFTAPPGQVLNRLAHMPYLPGVNAVTQRAEQQELPGGNNAPCIVCG